MDYNQTLGWLQNLLGNQQGINQSQFGQGLTAEQQALADTLSNQRTLQSAGITEGGRQFDASLALQKVISDWQNQLANKEFGLKSEAQKFAEEKASFPYQAEQTFFAKQLQPGAIEASNNWIQSLVDRYNPTSGSYAYGIPTNGGSYNPYSNQLTSSVGIPAIRVAPPLALPIRGTGY